MNHIISIDCGGSKTDIVVVDHDGRVLNYKTLSGVSYSYVTNEKFIEIIMKYIGDVLTDTDISLSSIKYVVLGSSGVYREAEKEFLINEFKKLSIQAYVLSDIEMAFYSACTSGVGIMLSVGTGSICFGIDKNGNKMRTGGWGYLLGDEGSGYYIGKTALNEVQKMYDRGEKKEIYKEVLNFYKLKDINDIIPEIYKSPNPVKKIADFAPNVISLSEKGDMTAKKIIEFAVNEIAQLVLNLYKRGDFKTDDFQIKVSGGLFYNHPLLFEKLEKKLSDFKVTICDAAHVLGGVIYLSKKLGLNFRNLQTELDRFNVGNKR